MKSLFLFLLPVFLSAQQPYFQQEVHYQIDIRLNDSLHLVQGTWEMQYTNHSPDTLRYILMHLWANAFQDRSSAFARQKLRENSLRFHFAETEERGGYQGLAFSSDSLPLLWTSWEGHPDIIRLDLPNPLRPGEDIRIQTPFTLHIPASFSRLGHVGQSYQMTQWYPKPAVYDREGWHPMPYLEWGEYYAEFGSFDVRITLPENYVTGATGSLQTPGELAFLREKVQATDAYLRKDSLALPPDPAFTQGAFPASSPHLKTIHYTAERVHDFAWFADKRFRVQKGSVRHPSGKVTDTWVMFTEEEEELWKNALSYVNRAVGFYSGLVGEYPYPHATAVQSALSAGGGMEYPMITVIGLAGSAQALDEVITHEVGHNWFYGILGFNERDHAWMDEGINSYYDHRYTRIFYPNNPLGDLIPPILRGNAKAGTGELAYLYLARQNRDQAPETSSGDFDIANYFIQSYEKPALVLKYLEHDLGLASFDAMMQTFFRDWAFRHPRPADFQEFLIRHSGKNLEWVFDGFLYSRKRQDYAIRKLKQPVGQEWQVTVHNRGTIAGPLQLSAIAQDTQILWQSWFNGFQGSKSFRIPAGPYDKIAIDPEHLSLDFQRRNNQYRMKGVFHKISPLKVGIWPMLEDETHTQFFLQPALSWNHYDKLQAGIWLHNTTIPGPRFSFSLLPFYATGSKRLTGSTSLRYRWIPLRGPWQALELRLQTKQYTYRTNPAFNYHLGYTRLAPSFHLVFRERPRNQTQHALRGSVVYLNQEYPDFSETGVFEGKEKEETRIQVLSYEGKNQNPLHPSRWRIAWERTSLPYFNRMEVFQKGSLEFAVAPAYRDDKRIYLRFFAGAFLDNNPIRKGLNLLPNAFSLSGQGFSDYRFEEGYIGRSEASGQWSRQIHLHEGGMKYAVGPAQRLGRSNTYQLALNLRMDPPRFFLNLPVQAYLDLGVSGSIAGNAALPLEDPFLWSGGLSFSVLNQRLAIFFPLVSSENIRQTYRQNGSDYLQKITFTLDLRNLNLQDMLENLQVF